MCNHSKRDQQSHSNPLTMKQELIQKWTDLTLLLIKSLITTSTIQARYTKISPPQVSIFHSNSLITSAAQKKTFFFLQATSESTRKYNGTSEKTQKRSSPIDFMLHLN